MVKEISLFRHLFFAKSYIFFYSKTFINKKKDGKTGDGRGGVRLFEYNSNLNSTTIIYICAFMIWDVFVKISILLLLLLLSFNGTIRSFALFNWFCRENNYCQFRKKWSFHFYFAAVFFSSNYWIVGIYKSRTRRLFFLKSDSLLLFNLIFSLNLTIR